MVGLGVGDSEKIVILGYYLIEFGEFSPQKGIYPPPLENNYPLESIYYT